MFDPILSKHERVHDIISFVQQVLTRDSTEKDVFAHTDIDLDTER